MSCNCTRTKPIPVPQSLIIGTLTADIDYYVYIKRGKRKQRYEATSNGAGLLTLNFSSFDVSFLSPYNSLILTVATQAAPDTGATITLPDASTATSLCLNIEKRYNEETHLDSLTATLHPL